MRWAPAAIHLNEEEVKTLTDWTRRGKSEHRLVERARIILLAHEGKTNQEIARQLHTRTARVSKWRQRFGKDRLAGMWRILRRHDICLERRRSWYVSTDPEFGP